MSAKQSKEVIANQNLLIESSKYGGPDNLRQYYMDQGAKQERNHIIWLGKNGLLFLCKVVEPFALKLAANRVLAFIDKKNSIDNAEQCDK